MGVKPGYKQTEAGAIPQEWEVERLKAIVQSPVTDGPHLTPKFTSDGIPFLSVNNLVDNKIDLSDLRFISQFDHEVFSKKCKPQKDDILLGKAASVGKVAIVELDYEFNIWSPIALIRVSRSHAARFVYYQLQTENLTCQITLMTNSSSQGNIGMGDIEKLTLILPPLSEQHAIATALSDVDGLLGGLDQLIAKKRDLKQAAMQELLSGKTRLPGFIDEWEVRRLGDLVQIEKGQLITRNTLLPGEIPVIAGGKKPAYHHAVANRSGRTITISASGANAGYVALYNDPIFASDCSTISESDRYCLDFVYHQLLRVQPEIYKLQTGGAQPHIHAKDLNPMTFSFPDLTEQTAIAGVLIDLDAEVAGLEARREKTQALKQGMMQELLSGRIRLLQPEALHA